MSETLFEMPPADGKSEGSARPRGAARVLRPNRLQVLMRASDLESLLEPEHRARVVWEFVSKLDLTRFYDRVASREGGSAPHASARSASRRRCVSGRKRLRGATGARKSARRRRASRRRTPTPE